MRFLRETRVPIREGLVVGLKNGAQFASCAGEQGGQLLVLEGAFFGQGGGKRHASAGAELVGAGGVEVALAGQPGVDFNQVFTELVQLSTCRAGTCRRAGRALKPFAGGLRRGSAAE